MEKTLMHTCCAPCSVSCIQQLRSEGIEPVSFWFNPNIHPYRKFCRAVAEDIEHRCVECYTMRMEQTARFAAENGFDSFTTTLLVSPYQQHEAIADVAGRMGQRYGVRFLYRDFRPGFRDGQAQARELGFYMQKYCGCVFSEEDRYAAKIAKDLKEPVKHIV